MSILIQSPSTIEAPVIKKVLIREPSLKIVYQSSGKLVITKAVNSLEVSVFRKLLIHNYERVIIQSGGLQGARGEQGIQGIQGEQGEGANLETDTGWTISGAYTPRKTIDLSNYTQAQLAELVATLIDTLKLSKIPSE